MSGWRPDLYSLRLFVAVCEEHSIARAAERESITPSAVSRRIGEIEELTGVELFVRGGRGVKPTPAGTAVLHHARQMLRSADKLRAELSEYAQGVAGHVRLCANISSIAEFLPGDLSSFLRQHKDIKVDLTERVSTAVVEAVIGQAAEIGICLDSVDTAGLQLVPYERDRLVVVVPPAHPLARREAVSFADALDHEFVGLAPESRMTSFLSDTAAQLGRTMTYRMHVASFEVVGRIVAEDLGIAIVPHDAAKPLQDKLGLALVPLAEAWAHRRIVMCMRDYGGLPQPARRLVDHLRARGEARCAASSRVACAT